LGRPARHNNIIRHIHEKTGDINITGLQGFLTSDGDFVTRTDAARIAFAAGQITEEKDQLYSEDLW
jgi:hypothetical protein